MFEGVGVGWGGGEVGGGVRSHRCRGLLYPWCYIAEVEEIFKSEA